MNARIDPAAVPAARRTLRFSRFTINGFKSFPERTEVLIEPGLTGIVGPNGCGKSNLLEALRWAMGETSARRMRGANMDDVIFGGTDRRPPRNVAEVLIGLDNSGRLAPPEFNGSDVLEVSRRIERGQGTAYRVNGQAARQRDVQILFQDNHAGANSPAIVSQGRVAALIAAKPGERRVVLEEAAGVSGLTARRHDTRLKLKATEDNLTRLDDMMAQSSDVLASLRRQARQVQRRREIDARVREALAMVLHLRHAEASRAEASAREAHEANERLVAQGMLDVAGAQRAREEVLAGLQPLRDARSRAEADHARAQARMEGAAAEAARIERALNEARQRIVHAAADRQRADSEIEEAERRVKAANAERLDLAARRAEEGPETEAASDALEDARVALGEADRAQAEAAASLAGVQAGRDAAVRARTDAERRVEAAERRLAEAERRQAAAREAVAGGAEMEAAEAALADAEERLSLATEAQSAAEAALSDAREADETAARARSATAATVSRLSAERDGLRAVRVDAPSRNPVSLTLAVAPGYEAAVAAALGEAALAGRDPSDASWWQAPPAVHPLWQGATLADVVSGVPELAAFAASVAVCGEEDLEGIAADGLPPGCSVVTLSGAFLRWDGLRGRPGAGKAQAAFERANRIRALDVEVAQAAREAESAEAGAAAARARAEAASAAEAGARSAARDAFDGARRAREALDRLRREHGEAARRLAVAESEVTGARAERQGLLADLAVAVEALSAIPDDAVARARVADAKAGVEAAREAESAARLRLERLTLEANARRQRFDACLRDEAAWTSRLVEARSRRDEMAERAEEAERFLAEAESAASTSPLEALDAAREAVDASRAAAEAAREAEAQAERSREAADAAVRGREAALSALREERARLLASVEIGQRAREQAVEEVRSQLSLDPDQALGAAAHPEGQPLPELPAAAARHARLEREREGLGAVNFLAEQELAEQEKRFGDIEKGRSEVRESIKRLNEALREIEDEARHRLDEAFRVIDGHFSDLFARLFDGGQAHLRLVGGEDILEAGLEIYASPPGKKMQILSLMSGGEQALTAMALIFAAFLSNPAPICVCDEVDAALDDANRDRLVRLMEAMARNDATRFLCITHSPLTMARMNRLYGVTMMERGVSTVTRVDLDRAIEIVDQ